MNYPQNHCYNPAFKYVRASDTDVRKTFKRVRTEQERTLEMVHTTFKLITEGK